MEKLLHIIATPREDESRTLQVSAAFLEAFRKKYPDCVIDELNLCKEEMPSLILKRVDGRYALLGGGNLFGKFKEAWKEIEAHIERFLSADAYLISTPMWNFSIPYMLKQYIDIIVQPRYLFRYVKDGVEGLARNKKMIVITSRGGEYAGEGTRSQDMQEPYLRLIFGFVGIQDITFVIAQPMDKGEVLEKQRLAEAQELARKAAQEL